MSQRLSDYFSQEASEYLDQLEALLAEPGTPDPDRLLQLARGVRGSAQMGGAEAVASVAERLEDAARSLASGVVEWSEELRGRARATVDDLQVLIRALSGWGPGEDARVRSAIGRWGGGGNAADEEMVVPVESLFYDDAGPHVLSPPAGPAAPQVEEEDVVPIESLLFRGDAALAEALRLRAEVEALLREPGPGADALAEKLRELFDLVELGRSAGAASG